MDRLLDAEVLFSGGSGQVDRDPQHDKNDGVSAPIKTQTSAFRDASQRGDTVAMRAYLDDALLLVNEDGVVSTRQSLRAGSPAVPPGARAVKVTLSDWVLHYSGDVAVSSFVDDQAVDYGGQSVDFKFLSVETWILRGTRWKLMGSETIPLHQNPPAANLPADTLSQYVGKCSDGAGLTVAISRDGDSQASSINGEKPTPLVAESRDVFFRPDSQPGYARRRILFHRGATGRVIEYASRNLVLKGMESGAASSQSGSTLPAVSPSLTLRDFVVHRSGDVAIATFLHDRVANYHGHEIDATYRSMETWVNRDGNWKMIASQARELQPEPLAAGSSPKPLDDYAGTYEAGRLDRQHFKVSERLLAVTNRANAHVLAPAAEDMVFIPGMPRGSIIFQRNRTGCVTGYLSREDERDVSFSRVQVKGDSLLNAALQDDRAGAKRAQPSHAVTRFLCWGRALGKPRSTYN
jgi:ketosteroid isomerase-like protein